MRWQVELAASEEEGMAMNAKRKSVGGAKGNPARIKVLMYHRIVDDVAQSEQSWTCVHVDELRKQLEFLDQWGFTTITFEDYSLFRQGKLHLPRKPIILTFDDGYLDTLEFAYPMLADLGMKGVAFVLGDRNISKNLWDEELGMGEANLMSAEDILALHEGGFEIGAHTMTHARLPDLSEKDAWNEISRPKMLLEILLNKAVRSFSYPYGYVNENVKRLVQQAGYTTACSVYSGPPAFGEEPFEIRRIAIMNTTNLVGFAAKVLTPFQYYEWLRWRTGKSLKNVQGRLHQNHPTTVDGGVAPSIEIDPAP